LAIDQQYPRAYFQAGRMHFYGRGVAPNEQEAVRLYRLGAERGNQFAQYELATLHETGRSVLQDHQEAARLYRLAIAQGHTQARTRLTALENSGVLINMNNGSPSTPNPSPPSNQRNQNNSQSLQNSNPLPQNTISNINLVRVSGVYKIPVRINDVLNLNFTVDSGASDVTIPADVVLTLVRTGTISDNDFVGEQTYVLADGRRIRSRTFRLRQLTVGDRTISNVMASVADVQGSLLLGQSFLSRFRRVSFDNTRGVLALE
jgi:hypothetical protein